MKLLWRVSCFQPLKFSDTDELCHLKPRMSSLSLLNQVMFAITINTDAFLQKCTLHLAQYINSYFNVTAYVCIQELR